jgi:recombination protein RecT
MNDKFTLRLGMERSLEHEPLTAPGGFPASDEERGEVAGFYAVAVFKDGSRTFVAMSRKEVEKIRDNSRGYQAAKRYRKESIWDSDFVSMGLKTAIRRLSKFLPKSPELATALALDVVSEQGRAQNLNLNEVIDGSYAPILDEEPGDGAGEPTPKAPRKSGAAQAADASAAHAAKADGEGAKPKQSRANPKLEAAVKAMEEATTVEALDEVYIRAEADFEDADLEALMREYRRIKANIGSLI